MTIIACCCGGGAANPCCSGISSPATAYLNVTPTSILIGGVDFGAARSFYTRTDVAGGGGGGPTISYGFPLLETLFCQTNLTSTSFSGGNGADTTWDPNNGLAGPYGVSFDTVAYISNGILSSGFDELIFHCPLPTTCSPLHLIWSASLHGQVGISAAGNMNYLGGRNAVGHSLFFYNLGFGSGYDGQLWSAEFDLELHV